MVEVSDKTLNLQDSDNAVNTWEYHPMLKKAHS